MEMRVIGYRVARQARAAGHTVTRILVPRPAVVWGVVVVPSNTFYIRPTDPTLRPRPIPTR
eukprot:7177683-Prymnesium_polylepis.1